MKRILLLVAIVLSANTVFSQMPTTNLLGWYPVCGDTLDHSGNARHLIGNSSSGLTAPAVLSADRFGNVNTAFEFNGVNRLMRTATFFTAGGDFSYSCWMNAYSLQSSVVIYNGNVTANGFGLVMNNGTIGNIGDSVSLLFGGVGLKIGAQVSLNQWHHLVFTRSINTYELYIDTVLIGTFTDNFIPLTSPDVFNVGNDFVSNSNPFNGQIDDIAVYNRHLSTGEIRALYNNNPDVLPFTLGNDTAICSTSIELAPSDNTSGAQYLWGTGVTAIAGTQTVTVSPPDFPGQSYWLTISKAYGCMQTDSILIRHITVGVNLGNDSTICGSTPVILGTPRPGETYLWSTGDTTGKISVNTPGSYWLTVDSLGCFGFDTININVKPPAIVDLGPDTNSCAGAAITLQSSAVYTASVTYLWEALPILSAPVATPTFVATVTGTYWVTVTDTNGCPGSDTVKVLIVDATYTFAQGDTAICMGTAFSPTVTVNPLVGYQWRPTTGMATSIVATPTIITSVSATYVLTGTYPGCPDKVDSFHLDVQPNPSISYLGQPKSVCIGDTVHLTAHVEPASYPGYIYSWSPGLNLDDSTAPVIVFTAGDTTNLVLTVTTTAGCTDKDSIMVNVHPSEFFYWDTVINVCPGDSVHLTPRQDYTMPEPTTVTWETIPTLYVPHGTDSMPWVYPITSQHYLTVGTSQFGCKDTGYTDIIVHPAAIVYLEDSTVIYPGESYLISPQTNATRFSWWPEIGLSDTTSSDPLATPEANTTYIVHASTEWGCQVTDSIKIRVGQTQIVLPNAFTPGADINNSFKIIKRGLASLTYFRIFDRWGKLVYESTDIDGGWDGTYKGKPQPFAVYVYEFEAITTAGKKYRKQGNVTLVR